MSWRKHRKEEERREKERLENQRRERERTTALREHNIHASKIRTENRIEQNRQYQETTDLLERYYQEAKAESLSGLKSEFGEWQLTDNKPSYGSGINYNYDWVVYDGRPSRTVTVPDPTKPVVVEEPKPAGVTLEELFAEDAKDEDD